MVQTLGEKIAIFVNTESKAGRDIYSSQIDQLIADHAPASTDHKELIEKYWLEIAGQSWPVTAESICDILTRFASEITGK